MIMAGVVVCIVKQHVRTRYSNFWYNSEVGSKSTTGSIYNNNIQQESEDEQRSWMRICNYIADNSCEGKRILAFREAMVRQLSCRLPSLTWWYSAPTARARRVATVPSSPLLTSPGTSPATSVPARQHSHVPRARGSRPRSSDSAADT